VPLAVLAPLWAAAEPNVSLFKEPLMEFFVENNTANEHINRIKNLVDGAPLYFCLNDLDQLEEKRKYLIDGAEFEYRYE
jgi:hypothetical protein